MWKTGDLSLSNVSLQGKIAACCRDSEYEELREHRREVAAEIFPYIQMGMAAYQDESLAAQFDFVQKSRLISNVQQPSKLLGNLVYTDTEVHVCILNESTAAFAFRGTELHGFQSLLDWRSLLGDIATNMHASLCSVKLYDAAKKPVYRSAPEMKVHKGYQLAFRDVTQTTSRRENLRMVLEDMGMKAGDVQRVVCVGHSLGGALATLCAKWCREVAFPDAEIKCVTAGSPRVGNSVFADDFNRKIDESYRVVNKWDWVPWMLPRLAGYQHVRGGIYLAKHPTISDSIACTWGGTRPRITSYFNVAYRPLDFFLHHPPANYLSSFEKVLLHYN